MSYLLDFIHSLTDEEMRQFRQLDLIGKQELVRDAYASELPANKITEAKIASRLKLTPAHFDKINSVLLDKIIYQLYGHDYRKILVSILTKGLSDLMWHELKIIQRRILKLNDKSEEEAFYKAAFNTLIKMFHPNYNSKLVHEYGRKYLQARGANKTIEDEIYIGVYSHYGDMLSQYLAGNEKTYAAQARKGIEKWEARLQGETNANALAHFYHVLGNYYKFYTEDADEFIQTNQNGLAALKKASPDVVAHLQGRLLCETGLGYMEKSEFEKSLAYYEQAFALSQAQFLKTYVHAGNYFYSALCARQPLKAKQIFETYLQDYLQPGCNAAVRFDILHMKFILAIHLKDYDKAFNCLTELREVKKKEVTLFGHSMLRFSETIYYYVTKDYKMAATIAKRNLKFLNLPENGSPQFDYQRQYLDCIGKLIKQKEGTLRLPEKLDKQIAGLRKGLFVIYNSLL